MAELPIGWLGARSGTPVIRPVLGSSASPGGKPTAA